MPMKVFVSDVNSWTLTPKSHNLTWPCVLMSMLDGFMSGGEGGRWGEVVEKEPSVEKRRAERVRDREGIGESGK